MTEERNRFYMLIESLFIALVAKVLVELVIAPWLHKEQTAGLPPSAGGCPFC